MSMTIPPAVSLSADRASGAHGSGERCTVAAADPSAFSTHRICTLRHDFHRHPLMRLEALASLAKRLYPTQQCRFIKSIAKPSSSFDHQSHDELGRTIDQVFENIEEPGSWVALYNVQTDPEYAGFLQEVMDSARPMIEREQPGVFAVGGFIFISAPPSVTPFHIDRENNFWLQIRGRKMMSVWDHRDQSVVAAADRERFILYGDNVAYKDACAGRSQDFDVGPGDGVYFPSTSPHMTQCERSWTSPGDRVSISIGVVFYTEFTRRMAYVHVCNEFLRKRGLVPTDPGEAGWVDRLKEPVGRALIWRGVKFHGFKPPKGF